ncbi:hypothetical protein MACH09_45920 [Vibrio sp. MACH09]|uniref:hypothetical protein n=1 Tax=Vibrio sp. MACH09 TaxID=3025122 RepID=UPI00278CDF6A|nr:hypothetical protein [Vibrio sp. MACH09]GLO64084.1 hypothetical protein MACH09_45920 [Vibrio sp. MACH09]
MLQFLKKWRQAFQSERAQRLHEEQEAERNVLCHNSAISVDEVGDAFNSIVAQDKESISWGQAFHQASVEYMQYEENQAYYEGREYR